MSSTLFVDSIEPNLSSGVHIPGHVIQVVSKTETVSLTSTSSTRIDTGLFLSITPKSATSKIIIIVDCNGVGKSSGNGYQRFVLMRDAIDLTMFNGEIGYTADSSTFSAASSSVTYFDSPNTVSSINYKVQMSNPANVGTIGMGKSSSASSITLMEIAQ